LTNDLDQARALLANDPDEMDEEWLAEIIAAVRAEAVAAERERIAQRVSAIALLEKIEKILVEDTNAEEHPCCGWGPLLAEVRNVLNSGAATP